MDDPYLDIAKLIERLHRRFLDVVRAELNQLGYRDLTPVQAMLLTNIGSEEIVIRELIERGYYQGSNVSYNMKKLVDGGYIVSYDVTTTLTQDGATAIVTIFRSNSKPESRLYELWNNTGQ